MKNTLEFLDSLQHVQGIAYFFCALRKSIFDSCPFSEDDQLKKCI